LTAADVSRTVLVREAATMPTVRLRSISVRWPSWPQPWAGSRVVCEPRERYLDRERQCQVQQRLLGHDNEPGQLLDPRRRPGSYRCTAGANRYRSSTRDVTVISKRPTTANFNLDRS
jgi:hypothetical protein